MIKLLQLELHNFMSHVDTVLNFDDYEGLVLIEGVNHDGHYSSNGSGKSTLLEGIVYALTGNTLRGVGVNDVINRNYKKNTRVTLKFMKGEDTYEISRYRKDDVNGDNIVFMRGEENISKRINKDTQQLIDDTLGISFKVFVSTVLLGEGLSSKFTQLSDPEKKSLIESTLNLSYDMNELRAKANSKLSQLKLDKSNLEGQISALEGYVDFDIETAQQEIQELEIAYTQKIQLADVKNNEIGCTNQKINQLVDKMNLVKSSIDKIDYLNRDLSNLDNENARLIGELTNAEKCENPRCTVCHQELASDDSKKAFRSSYQEMINNISAKIAENKTQLDNLPDRSILTQSYDKFSLEVTELRQEVTELTTHSRQIQDEAYQLKTEIDRLTSGIDSYNKARDNIDDLKNRLSTTSSQAEIYDYFYKLFSPTGIITDILSEAIEYINDRISTYSEVLLDKRYKIDFKKGKISLIDDSGASYQSLSNGEKRRLDIAIQFSLHDYVTMYCGMRMNCCYIDEVLDTLDDTGVDNIFEVLRLKLDYCGLKSIYVITHNDSLKSKFDHIITVSKNSDGNSTIL